MEEEKKTVRIMSVGDMLMHMEIVGSGDYSALFEHMKDTFAKADLLSLNQETILTDHKKPSGFPVFASPTQVGQAEIEAGFTLFTCASNHTLDQWDQGMEDTFRFFEEREGVFMTGIRKRSEPFPPVIIEKNGIRIAVLAYTAPMNFHLNLPFLRYHVETLKPYRKKAISKQMKEAKKKADILIVFPHWGCEYLYAPTEKQRKWAEFFAKEGADLIIGTHPHVLQPPEEIIGENGGKVPVFYSLGNYVSAQKRPGTMLGGLADVLIEKDSRCTRIASYELVPLVASTDEECSRFTVCPLDEYPDERSQRNKLFRIIEEDYGVITDKAYLKELFEKILDGRAQKENPFQRPLDVSLYNAKRILKLIGMKISKERRR